MSLIDDVNSALGRGNFAEAADHAAAAVAQGLRTPALLNLAAFKASEAERYDEALLLLHEALDQAPQDANVLYSIGFCQSRLGQDDAALAAFDSALAVRPAAAPLYQKGLILERRGDDDGALRHYEMAMAADPRFEDPYAGVASIACNRGDYVKARSFASQAHAIAPTQIGAHLALAKADFNDGLYDAVIARLAPLTADRAILAPDRPAFLALLGDALDARGQVDEAFTAWAEGKAIAKKLYAHDEIAVRATAQRTRLKSFKALTDDLGVQTLGLPDTRLGTPAPKQHVFLVGFPRSGTTLLEQILATDPGVVTIEEQPLLSGAEDAFLLDDAGFRRLVTAPDDELAPYRESYWRKVQALGLNASGKVLLDKFPLNSLLLPLIGRLFPGAKILFARRDPRDVVLSCFRRSFRMNPAMYQFVTLESTASFYADAMAVSANYLRVFPLPVHNVRYEALVADFDTECQAICAFIGLTWTEGLRDFADSARKRAIRTPSAAQVRKGLYTDGAGQWRRYVTALTPVLPIIQPWVEAFGYWDETSA